MVTMARFVPTVLEASAAGERAFDLYSALLRERIVFLGQEVDDQIANLLIGEILFLEAQDPERDICLYINSPGGLSYAGFAIYDVMQHVRPDVSTICVGMGMSAAAMILSGGAPGKRLALPNARIMIHQGSAGAQGAPRDMEIQLREVLASTRRMAEIIAHHSGRSVEQVQADIDRDYFMTAEEARRYGLIDEVLEPRRGIAARLLASIPPAAEPEAVGGGAPRARAGEPTRARSSSQSLALRGHAGQAPLASARCRHDG